MSNTAKVILGCGIGCLVLVLLIGIAALIGVWWTLDPGEQVATRSVIGPDCAAAVHYSGEGGGAGLVNLVEHAMVEAQRLQSQRRREELPEGLRWLESLQAHQRRADAESLLMWVPREATLIVEEGPDEPSFLAAANFRMLVRAVRTLLLSVLRSEGPQDHVRIAEHGEHEIVVFDGEVSMCFVGGTVLLASDAAMVERAIDRVEAIEVEETPGGGLTADLDAMLDRWPVAGVVDNRGGLLQRQRHSPPPPPPTKAVPKGQLEAAPGEDRLAVRLEGLERVVFGARVTSADVAEAEAVLNLVDGEEAAAWAEYLAEELGRSSARLAEHGLELHHEIEVVGSSLTLTVEARGLEQAVDRWLQELFDEMDER